MTRSCIVTGSARGIGRAIALRLAADGYDVCVNDISANKAGADEVAAEIKKLGRKSIVVIADVSKRSEVENMVKTSVAELGPLHTMVANAGIAQVEAQVDLSEQDFERMFQVNVFGVNNCFTTAAKQMIAQGKLYPGAPRTGDSSKNEAGVYKIIGAASIVAFKAFPMLTHYSASKWAVRGLTQGYAMEMADHGICVNSYAPGIVGTAMWDLIDEKLGNKAGAKKGETIKKYSEELIALKRTSTPEDVSNLVHFLASPDSDYVTGQTILADGGIVYT